MNELSNKNITELKNLLGKLNGDYVTKEDFIKAFQIFKGVLMEMQNLNVQSHNQIHQASTSTSKKHEDSLNELRSKMDKAVSDLSTSHSTQIESVIKDIKSLAETIPDPTDLSPLEEKVNSSIAELEAKIPQLPEELKPEAIRNKLETLKGDERLDKTAIRGLDDEFKNVNERLSKVGQSVSMGGKLPRGAKFSFAGDGATTKFYVPTDVSGKGLFIWAHYQGQWLQQGVHYSLKGKLFDTAGGTSTFTAATGTVIEGFIITL